MHLEVMYSEPLFHRIKVDETEIDSLPKNNVLCMVLIEDGELRWRFYQKDYFAIGFVGDRFFVDEWDDEDILLRIRSVGDKKWDKIKYSRFRPENATVYTFTGAWIPTEQWKKAIEIMNKEMR